MSVGALVFQMRRDPYHPPMDTDGRVTLAYVPAVTGNYDPPERQPDGHFYAYGRDPAHAPTPIRRHMSDWSPEYHSIQAQHFAIPKIASALVVGMTGGKQMPLTERVNIVQPRPTTLGAQASAYAPTSVQVDPAFAKLVM